MDPRHIRTEIDAAYLYERLASREKDPVAKSVFAQMAEIERGHARAFAQHAKRRGPLPGPSVRARTLDLIGRVFSDDFVLGVLMETEKTIAASVVRAKREQGLPVTGAERSHVAILRSLARETPGEADGLIGKIESRHRSVGGNALRAAVLGGNDGLVSNFSLVMGISGAAQSHGAVLLAGFAGLLAGALSMALGEWISVKSSQELSERQMQLERDELETDPEGEERELALIYQSKGVAEAHARELAAEVMQDKERAYDILVKEELGIDVDELKGSAWEAAIYSFVLFSLGAVVPVLPFVFLQGAAAITVSAVASGLGLFAIGATITLFTGRNVWFSGLRQALFGLTAAAITYAIGRLLGVSVIG